MLLRIPFLRIKVSFSNDFHDKDFIVEREPNAEFAKAEFWREEDILNELFFLVGALNSLADFCGTVLVGRC